MVGSLVDVGRGRFSVEHFKTILEQNDRTKAGECAPPDGLFLMKVHYPEDKTSQ